MINLAMHGSCRVSGGGGGIPMDATCQRKPMVPGTVGGTQETTVESQLSVTVSEGDF